MSLDYRDIEQLVVDLTKKLLRLKELKSWDGFVEMGSSIPMDNSVSIATTEAEIKKLIRDTHRSIERNE